MMSCQKRCQPNSTDSVIARLMGFDELRPQKPLREKHRGLSASYVHNAASVGLRPGSFVSTGWSCSTKNEVVHEVNCTDELQISKVKNDNIFDKCINSSASKVRKSTPQPKHASALVSVSSSGASHKDRRSSRENGRRCASRHVLRYLQKHEHDSLADHLGELSVDDMKKSLELQEEMKDKPCIFSTSISAIKPKSDLQDVKLDRHFELAFRKQRKSFKSENGKGYHQLAYKEPVVSGIVSHRHSCIVCSRTMSRFCRQESRRSKFDQLLRTRYMGNKYIANEVEELVLSSPGVHEIEGLVLSSPGVNEFMKQDFERLKTAKVVQEVGVCVRGQTLDKLLDLTDKKSVPINSACKLSDPQSTNSGSSSPSVHSSIDIWEDDYLRSLQIFEFEAIKEALSNSKQVEYIAGDNYLEEQTISQPKCERAYERFTGVDDTMLVSGEEASLNEFSEEESTYSNCSRIGPLEFQDNLKRTYQQSPDSVLQPFDIQKFSTVEHFDSIGLQLQLQALNFDSEETYSEGSVMLVSGDEDFDQRLNDLSHDVRKVKRWLGDNKSRNYSYMVDVLDETGFFGMKSFLDFKTWHSLECPISSSVFDTLEKKYGKQTSWHKSERQLLFDRINSGLISIFNPVINPHACSSSIRSRFCTSLRRDEVEDELWMMLIGLDKETSKDLSENVFGKWFDIKEDINILCGELETTLFDELLMELASLWD